MILVGHVHRCWRSVLISAWIVALAAGCANTGAGLAGAPIDALWARVDPESARAAPSPRHRVAADTASDHQPGVGVSATRPPRVAPRSQLGRTSWATVGRHPSLWMLAARLALNPSLHDPREQRLRWYADRPPLAGARGANVEWRVASPIRHEGRFLTFELELVNRGPGTILLPPLNTFGVLLDDDSVAEPYLCEWVHYRHTHPVIEVYQIVLCRLWPTLGPGTRVVRPLERVRLPVREVGGKRPASFSICIIMYGSSQELIVLPNQHIADQRIERWEDFDPAVHVLSGTFRPGGPNPPPRRQAE